MTANFVDDPLLIFPDRPPERIVSLVPSYTGSLYDLALEHALVGVTDYCVYPPGKVEVVAHVGGPKNPRLEDILRLKPDLVLANREENDRKSIEALAEAGLPVWLTFPTSVRDGLDNLWSLARLFRSETAMQRIRAIEQSLEWAQLAAADQPALRYFCPIWEDRLETGQRWWMTFNEQTYSSSILNIFNGVNVFATRQRRYPLLAELGHSAAEDPAGRDVRYPRVSFQEIVDAQPDLILLPDEPFAYNEQHVAVMMDLFRQTPAGVNGRVHRIDGSLIHWPGTRLARALVELPEIFLA